MASQKNTSKSKYLTEKRSKEFLNRINSLIEVYRYPSSSKGESLDSILLGKIRDESLKDQIPDKSSVDTKTYTSTLLRLKEEQAERDLAVLKKTINEVELELGSQLVDIKLGDVKDAAIQEDLRNKYKNGNVSATGIFYDEDLAKARIRKRIVKRKDGTEYTRDTTAETTLNEWLRQISDTKYPGVTKQVENLRKRYLKLSGQEDYKQPSSTLHRETVVLREKIGKLISEKTGTEEKLSPFSKADKSLVYRRIADKITSLNNDALSVEQESVINKLLFNLNTDIGILESYEQIAKVVGLKERPAKNLSSRDKIEFYRKYLSSRLGEVKGNQSIDKLSPGYLDLISANKEKDPNSYAAAKKELISVKREGLWDARIKKFENPNDGKPKENLALWLRHADVSIEENSQLREELFSPTTTLTRFNELLEDSKYRNAMPRVSYEQDGKIKTKMAGITARDHNGVLRRYRVNIPGREDLDLDQLKGNVLQPIYDDIIRSKNRIAAARKLTVSKVREEMVAAEGDIFDSLEKSGEDSLPEDDPKVKKYNYLEKLLDFLEKPTRQVRNRIKEKGYSAGIRLGTYEAEKLRIEADIYEADPNARISLDSSLYGDARLSALRDIRTNKQWAAADVQGLSDGLSAPDFVADMSVERQLKWWQTAVQNRSELLAEDFDTFQQRYYGLKSSERKAYVKSLPANSLISDEFGNVYRPDIDEDIVKSKLSEIAQLQKDIQEHAAKEIQRRVDNKIKQYKLGIANYEQDFSILNDSTYNPPESVVSSYTQEAFSSVGDLGVSKVIKNPRKSLSEKIDILSTIKARYDFKEKVLDIDPNFKFKKGWYNEEKLLDTLTNEKQELEILQEKYKDIDNVTAHKPIREQLVQWRDIDQVIIREDQKSFAQFNHTISWLQEKGVDYKKFFPKGYVVEVKGAATGDTSTLYRATADKEMLDELEKKLDTTIRTLFEQDQQGLKDHYDKRLEDLSTRRKMLEEKDAAEKTKEDTEELEKMLTTEQELQTKRTALDEADNPVIRINEKAATQGQRISWKQQSAELLQLQRDIRDIIPSVSFKDIFDEREKDTKVDKKTKYSNRIIALREIRDELKAVQKESFEDFQKRAADLGSLPPWLPKHSLIKIGKEEEGQDVRYYRTFVEEDTQQLDKEIQGNLDIISKADKNIQEIFKEQANKKLEYLREQEQQYPTLDGSERKQAIERLEERSKKLKDQSNAADQIKDIGGYNARYQVAQKEATNLPKKLEILRADPNYYFGEDFKYEDTETIIDEIKSDTKDLADIRRKYEDYDNKYLSKFKPVEEQLAWWQVFDKEYEWLTDENTTKEEITAAFDNLDSAGRQNYYRILPDNFFNTFFVRKEGFLHRVGRDITKEEAGILRSKPKLSHEIKEARENVILSTGQETEESTTTTLNQFGESNQGRMATEEVITKVSTIANLDGDEFSEQYGALSAEEKQVYNRNFNEPVKSGTKWYKNIFVMPRDAWVTAEKESGHSTPRIRPGIDEESYYDKSAEAEFQKQVTADIKGRSWDFVPKQKPAVAEQQREPVINSNDVEQPLVQEQQVRQRPPRPVVEKETQSNLSKMLQRLKSPSSLKSIGMMGMAGAFALWNMAMTGPTKEAQEHKRRVEEERRMRQYGY